MDGDIAGVGDDTVPAGMTSRDETWAVEVVASDGEWDTDPMRAFATILDTAPETTQAALEPGEPTTDEDLVLTVAGEDADGDPVSFRTVWSADGVEQRDWDDLLTLPASATARDETWTVSFTPWDDRIPGTAGSLSVTIVDSAPTLAAVHLSPTEPTAASTMTATLSNLRDPDSDPIQTTVAWYVDDTLVETDTMTSGSTTTTLGLALVRGETVRAEATPSDGTLTGATVRSDEVEVINAPPTLTTAILTPTTATESTLLVCSPSGGSDIDGDDIDYVYDWVVAGTSLGLDRSTLDGSRFARGDAVYCVITPTDGEDGEPVASNTVTIANSPPTFTSVTLSPSSVTRASTVTATPAGWSDADGDSPIYAYSWTVNGAHVSGTTASLSLSPYARGSTVVATVASSDGTDAGPTLSSSPLTIQNAPPSISSATITPSTIYATSTLTAGASGWSDPDGDPASYLYAWTVNGAAAGSGSTLSGCFVRGNRVQVTITPYDGYDSGTARTSAAITVSNSAPVALALVTDPQPVESCGDVQLTAASSTDADGDTLTYTWSVTLIPATSRADASYFDGTTLQEPLFFVDAAGTWNFRVTVNDGSASASDDVLMASAAPADNTAPVADAGNYPNVRLTAVCRASGSGVVCDKCRVDVSLDGSGTTDADGDPIDLSWSAVASPSGPSFAFDDDEAERPVLTIGSMSTTFGVTTTYTIAVDLDVRDCGDATDADQAVFDLLCTGI